MFQPKLLGSASELIIKTHSNPTKKPALGSFADYRVELQLALLRATEMMDEDTGVFIGSVIDNVAYHFIRYEDFTRSEVQDEGIDTRYYLTSALLYATLTDSLRADVVAYLPLMDDTPTTDYNYRVGEFMEQTLNHFNVSYLRLEDSLDKRIEAVSQEINRLQKEAYEQRDDLQEPRQEESE